MLGKKTLCLALGLVCLTWGVRAADVDAGDSYYSPYNYGGTATFTFTNYTGTVRSGEPVYLRVSEALVPGFSYSDLKNGKDDIVFFSSLGRVLPVEVETWDPEGESHFWVLLPYLRNGETVTMCWNLRDGCAKPDWPDTTRLWENYLGVWHMDEEITSESAALGAHSVDATGHGYDIVSRTGSKGDLSRTVSTSDSVFGLARVNDTSAPAGMGGNGFFISGSEAFQFDGTFTISFWIKFDSHANNWPQILSGRYDASTSTGVQVDLSIYDRKLIVVRGNGGGGTYTQVVNKNFDQMGFVHLAFVYDGTNAKAYSDGALKIDTSITAVTTNLLMLGNNYICGEQSVYGKFDEVRLYKGVRTAEEIAFEHAQATNDCFWVYGNAETDADAVLKNEWKSTPSITKTLWDADDPTDRPSMGDFSLGTPSHGVASISFYNKTTGEWVDPNRGVPTAPGEYRAVITVPESTDETYTQWGALSHTIDFRIVSLGGTKALGINIDRVLLLNDDYSAGDEARAEWQSYDNEDSENGVPYWQHLNEDLTDASTSYDEYWSVSPDFNLGGGVIHRYFYGSKRYMWELYNARIGNTFHNGEDRDDRGLDPEEDAQGLECDQNYLPWNPAAQRVLFGLGDMIGPYHRYAGQIVMRNALDAAITSTMYTNGIGTVYFDAVNGWTNNTYGADGSANYRLVVEIATNTDYSAASPTDERVNSVYMENRYDENGVCTGEVAVLRKYAEYADWRRVPVRVLYFDGGDCTDLGFNDSLTLDVEQGGSYDRFYRIIAPVNVRKDVRFRIRRVAIDPDQSMSPDGSAYLLVDNVICSTPADYVNLGPYGRYVASKTGHQVQGYESAFIPAFPSVGTAMRGRAKATMANGGVVPDKAVTSATMHYRWHYLDQCTTAWQLADLDPTTLITRDTLNVPASDGDIEFWFDVNQSGNCYKYVDYSGTGLELGDSDYSEAISSVTNRANAYATKGDWFVRLREGTSSYAEMKLVVRTKGTGGTWKESEYGLDVTGKNLWSGYYRMTEVIADGLWWRIEGRDRQEDGATAWASNTNYWYVTDWTETMPSFPAAGRMVTGDTNSWSRVACDMQTGYLQFQVDESTLGVTVIHADHQDFNHWNDADTGYFNGSSSETNAMHGTSANVREYQLGYAGWTDTPATNNDWSLIFTGTIGDPDYPGYQTFLKQESYFRIWDLGEGMWVYGSYREPKSPVAFQMAGSRRGYLEFCDPKIQGDNWPRGFESVSFNARIAQPISPKYLSYAEDSSKLTNYTFMARACFDMHRNTNFTGNAALSVYAYYRSNVGCYEARWEQVSGNIETTDPYTGLPISPVANGQRLVISRWNKVGDEFVETELIAATNSALWKRSMPLMPYATGESLTNNLMPILISAYQTEKNGPTYITAAVRITSDKQSGVSADTEIPMYVAGSQIASKDWCFVTYKDTTDSRLTRGSYGVLSSNCEGLFVRPQFRAQAMWPGNYATPQEVVNNWKLGVQGAVAASASPVFVDCRDDMEAGDWSINPGREEPFFGGKSTDFGFAYVLPSQTIDVYTKTIGSSADWSLLKQIKLTGFGHPGYQPDYQPCFYHTADSALRLETGDGQGGTSYDNPRVDVVISDIVQRQWRGYDSGTDESIRYNHTNFVFTTGWVTNGAAQLSAKRTPVGTPCSIRSPLLDGDYDNGTGLGMFKFTYREPQKNIRLLVQIATNVTGTSLMNSLTQSVEEGDGNKTWLTVAKLSYNDLWADNPNPVSGEGTKTWDISFGYHGAKGLMRVVVDPTLVEELSDINWTDTSLFGAIDITSVYCTDEPALDKGCWWGWNIQTGGSSGDSQHRMYLPDYSSTGVCGRWLALNNSVTDSVDPSDKAHDITKHMPFLQSPTFTNALIGQVTFKARKYDLSERSPDAKIVVYGTDRNPDAASKDSDWTYVTSFDITNALYTTYTAKITNDTNFCALRLAVVDVPGTEDPPSEPPKGTSPQRVLIDEVSVSEAVRAMLAFRNVGAFRSHLDADNNDYVPGVTTWQEQPLCDENWGIQAEVFATMLGDEIDKDFTPVVTLDWYVGKDRWGYPNWKNVAIDNKTRGRAQLEQTYGSNYTYRASYPVAPEAIMAAQSEPGTVVQYSLEVEYQILSSVKTGETPQKVKATSRLDSTGWTVPDWYAPVNYNSDPDYGAGKSFAAFTILDNVAPTWAWINEANIYGDRTASGGNSDEQFQYVEVCAPMEADLTGWQVRLLEYQNGNKTVVTNTVAKFGTGTWDVLPGKKRNLIGNAEKKVFHLIGNKESDRMKKSDGTLDGVWRFSQYSNTFRNRSNVDCIADYEMPIGVQLVRASGVIESSVVVMGTNSWGRLPSYPEYNPTNIVNKLNQNVPGSKFFYAAEDRCGTKCSASVVDQRGASADVWVNDWACSPGRINTNFTGQVQKIEAEHPTPHGDSIIVYASVDTSFGHILQSIGGTAPATNMTAIIILAKGNLHGTNIVYTTDPWYELKSVMTNGAPQWVYEKHVRRYEAKGVGAGASNNVEIVAAAQIDSTLRDYGLTDDYIYTPAVMDWLVGGQTLKRPFANNGEIVLADYVALNNDIVTNMTLTQMYWLDMDPTISNQIFKAGMLKSLPCVWPIAQQDDGEYYAGDSEVTNIQMTVFMMISNKLDNAYAPYVLRSVEPGVTSWDYDPKSSGNWTSETFKVTGLLANGLTRESNLEFWLPLRLFVFGEDSFTSDFTTEIEIADPHVRTPLGGEAWYKWFHDPDHPEQASTPVFYSWSIDERMKPLEVQILQTNNFYQATQSD